MWHQHDDERLGRDIHWACHRFLVRFFTILYENFPVSRLASKAAICYSSPSASGGALIILRQSNSLSSRQRILSSLFLGNCSSSCCLPNQACKCRMRLLGADKPSWWCKWSTLSHKHLTSLGFGPSCFQKETSSYALIVRNLHHK